MTHRITIAKAKVRSDLWKDAYLGIDEVEDVRER